VNAIALVLSITAAASLVFAAVRVARFLASSLGLSAFSVPPITTALALGGFLIPLAIVGRTLSSLDAGLAGAVLVGVPIAVLSRRMPAAEGPAPLWPSRRFLIVFSLAAAAAAAIVAAIAFKYQILDEFALSGHKPKIEELRHGIYPIFDPPFPTFEAHYHVGFDVLAGVLARAFGLSTDWAIDLVTVALAVFTSWATSALVLETSGEKSAPFAAIAVHLGAGLAFFMLAGVEGRHPRCLMQYYHETCGVELLPTQLLNLFQHPNSLGLPLFLVVALLAPRLFDARGRGARVLAASTLVILAGLSISQIVFYGIGSLAVLASALVHYKKSAEPRRAKLIDLGRVAAVVIGALLVARFTGGVFAGGDKVESGLALHLGFPERYGPLRILYHHAVNLGLGFVLFPVIAYAVWRRANGPLLVLMFFALGGLSVAQLFAYTKSWDIVKFPAAAAFALSILYVAVADAWIIDRARWGRWVAYAGRVLLVGTGVFAAYTLIVPPPPNIRPYPLGNVTVDPMVKKCIDWWIDHGYQREMIFAQSNIAQELAIYGGLAVVLIDADLPSQLVKRELLNNVGMRGAEIKMTMAKSALDALEVRWIMLSDEEIPNLGPDAQRALMDPARFEVVASFDGAEPRHRRRIWRVK
jgi:hypothetical protein